jgi:hypothetical protein
MKLTESEHVSGFGLGVTAERRHRELWGEKSLVDPTLEAVK